jgi:hypothetical protein
MNRIELYTTLILIFSIITQIISYVGAIKQDRNIMSSIDPNVTKIIKQDLTVQYISLFLSIAIYSYFIFFRSKTKGSVSYTLTTVWLLLMALGAGMIFSVFVKVAVDHFDELGSIGEKATGVTVIILQLLSFIFLSYVSYKRIK